MDFITPLVSASGSTFILKNICLKIHVRAHIRALARANLSSGFANNKGADQPAHLHSLISAFVICILESIIS